MHLDHYYFPVLGRTFDDMTEKCDTAKMFEPDFVSNGSLPFIFLAGSSRGNSERGKDHAEQGNRESGNIFAGPAHAISL